MDRLPRWGVLVLLLLAGCASTGPTDEEDWTAAQFYQAAKKELEAGDYLLALEYYEKLESHYPFGPYTQQGQLETIYAYLQAEEPESAIAAASRFIKLHPRHPRVDYAYYLRGVAAMARGASPLGALAPQDPARHDPAGLREAFGYFRELVRRFPQSPYAADAAQRMRRLKAALARHELEVGRYYLARQAYVAAANRARAVLQRFGDSPARLPALRLMAAAYRGLGLDDLAADAERILELNRSADTP